jgi:two-component system response regulator DesR
VLLALARSLTGHEREVLAASRRHLTVAELAGAVYLSQGTVRNPISAAIGKLDARNRLDAMQIAEDDGWL